MSVVTKTKMECSSATSTSKSESYNSAPILDVVAIIVRRRSMGRNLAFADIDIVGGASNEVLSREIYECNDTMEKQETQVFEEEVRVQAGRIAEPLSKTQLKNNGEDDERSKSVLQIVFRRHSPSWDRNFDETFPTKNSELPYGAKVHLKLNVSHKGENKAKGEGVHNQSVTPRYEVQQWSILEDPRVEAIRNARQQKLTKNSESSSTDIKTDTSIDAQTDESLGAGISCSKYFSSRMNQYLKYNPNPPRDGDRNSKSRNMKGNEKLNSRGSKDCTTNNIDTKLINEASVRVAHGNKKDKALRAKIFASFLIQKFGSELFRGLEGGLCHEISRTDGTEQAPINTPPRILDVAGGKGQLSIELAIQSNCLVQCTIIDPLIRGKGNEATLKRRDVKRIQKAYNQRHGREQEVQQVQDEDKKISSQCVLLPVYISKCFTLQDEECIRMVKQSSVIVGLHPDEPTEDIIDAAIQNNIPAAIVPCCVFAYLRPERRLKKKKKTMDASCNLDKNEAQVNEKDGDDIDDIDHGCEVRSYEDFIEYLMEKDSRIEKTTLPFEGRNIVLTFNPR